MQNANIKTLIDEATIQARVRELGAKISADYAGKEVVLVPVLKGSFIFAADLARAIDLPVSIDFFGFISIIVFQNISKFL